MKKCLLLCILFLATITVFADQNIITTQVKGQGGNRSEAIENAIVLAVGQLFGIQVDTGRESFKFDTTHINSDRNTFDLNDISIRSQGTKQNLSLDGLIKSFEIIEEAKQDSIYEVTLKVIAYDYKGYENKDRIRIALMPFKSTECTIPKLADLLNQKVTQALSNTNKFALLDRSEVADFEKEMNIIKSTDTSVEEKAKAKKVLGTDYILIGSIDEGNFVCNEKTLKITNSTTKEYKARFAFSFKVIEGPTRITKFSDEIRLNLKANEVKSLFEKWDPAKTQIIDIADKVMDVVANTVAQRITQQFYPVRILAVNDSQVIISNAVWLKPGCVMDVFKTGQDIIDYDTNEKLGQTETKCASIRIESIQGKLAYANIINHAACDIARGDICRVSTTSSSNDNQDTKKTDVIIKDNGGVVLPFDK